MVEAITIIDCENHDSPNVGTVVCNFNKKERVIQKIRDAIEAHMDAEVISAFPQLEFRNGMVDRHIPIRLSGDVEDRLFVIQQTWIY